MPVSPPPDMPDRIAGRPTDHRGYPVPWFAAWINGAPDFRVVDPSKVGEAWTGGLCWVCGQRLGAPRR